MRTARYRRRRTAKTSSPQRQHTSGIQTVRTCLQRPSRRRPRRKQSMKPLTTWRMAQRWHTNLAMLKMYVCKAQVLRLASKLPPQDSLCKRSPARLQTCRWIRQGHRLMLLQMALNSKPLALLTVVLQSRGRSRKGGAHRRGHRDGSHCMATLPASKPSPLLPCSWKRPRRIAWFHRNCWTQR